MKYKRLVPLFASILLLAGCSNNGSSSTPSGDGGKNKPAEVTPKMSTIDLGKMYIDINFATIPEGFVIKTGGETITSSTMISVIASSTFTVEDTFSKVNVYRATETSAGGLK